MHTWTMIAIFFLNLLYFGQAAGQRSTPQQIVINSVAVDVENEAITISGQNLVGRGIPSVTLGEFELIVDSAVDTEIVALLPSIEIRGDFLLTVITGPSATDSVAYDLTIPQPSAALTGREVVSAFSSVDSAGFKNIVVECPNGKVALGGGGRMLFVPGTGLAGQSLVSSRPLPENPSAWEVAAAETIPTANDWQLRADVVCVVAAD